MSRASICSRYALRQAPARPLPPSAAVMPRATATLEEIAELARGRTEQALREPDCHDHNWFITLAVPRDYDRDSDRAEGQIL